MPFVALGGCAPQTPPRGGNAAWLHDIISDQAAMTSSHDIIVAHDIIVVDGGDP